MARRRRAELEGVDALFGTPTSEGSKSRTSEVHHSGSENVPKYERMEPWTARVRPGQAEFLQQLAKEITASRAHRQERVTKNTVLRAWLAILEEVRGELDLTEIADEDELVDRLRGLVARGDPPPS